jgi:hypothetical protein
MYILLVLTTKALIIVEILIFLIFLKNYTACQDYFGKSLFVLGEIGGNDYNFALSSGKSISEAMSYVPAVMDTIKQAAEVSTSI